MFYFPYNSIQLSNGLCNRTMKYGVHGWELYKPHGSETILTN